MLLLTFTFSVTSSESPLSALGVRCDCFATGVVFGSVCSSRLRRHSGVSRTEVEVPGRRYVARPAVVRVRRTVLAACQRRMAQGALALDQENLDQGRWRACYGERHTVAVDDQSFARDLQRRNLCTACLPGRAPAALGRMGLVSQSMQSRCDQPAEKKGGARKRSLARSTVSTAKPGKAAKARKLGARKSM